VLLRASFHKCFEGARLNEVDEVLCRCGDRDGGRIAEMMNFYGRIEKSLVLNDRAARWSRTKLSLIPALFACAKALELKPHPRRSIAAITIL